MAKRENGAFSIKDLMKHVVQQNNLQKGLQKVDVADAWNKLMGNGITNYTASVTLQGGVLIVKLTSSVLREELSYGKDKIVKMINEEVGQQIVQSIRLV